MNSFDSDRWTSASVECLRRGAAAVIAHSGVLQIGEKKARGGLNLPGVWFNAALLSSDPPAFCTTLQRLERVFTRHFFTPTARRNFTFVCVMSGGAPYGAYLGVRYSRPVGYAHKDGRLEIQDRALVGQHVVLVEDVLTEGGSIERAAEAVQAHGGVIDGALALIDYDLAIAKENLKRVGIPCYSLTTARHVVSAAHARGMLSDEQVLRVARWIENPT